MIGDAMKFFDNLPVNQWGRVTYQIDSELECRARKHHGAGGQFSGTRGQAKASALWDTHVSRFSTGAKTNGLSILTDSRNVGDVSDLFIRCLRDLISLS